MEKKLNYETLFYNALTFIIEYNGGSIEEALDYVGVKDEEERKQIRKEFNWDDELEVEEEVEVDYEFDDAEDCANVVGKALDLPYSADAYDNWCYVGLLSDLINGRGDEWLDDVIATNNKSLINAFKKFIHYEEDEEEEE